MSKPLNHLNTLKSSAHQCDLNVDNGIVATFPPALVRERPLSLRRDECLARAVPLLTSHVFAGWPGRSSRPAPLQTHPDENAPVPLQYRPVLTAKTVSEKNATQERQEMAERIDALRTELADLAFTLDRRGNPAAADVAACLSARLAEWKCELGVGDGSKGSNQINFATESEMKSAVR